MFPSSVEETQRALEEHQYIADRGLAVAVFLALRLGRPLLLEGEPGVGKTEVVKVLAQVLSTRLIRLQCYEGLDVSSAVYEWDYARQMLQIRLLEAAGERTQERIRQEVFGPRVPAQATLAASPGEPEWQTPGAAY
ncbi:MAG: MoxR family ATPase [Meiothermus sp.]|uniref:AAA family ATPase n=1 Tax=Meiothermus sp. TaxID=1955249 RepID=UPI00298EDB96|nr:MoxR family ATPase [Meiothermus sp.]MDW8481309.1 MoxR family ATPase [Meiothermus sp.]